MLPKPSEETTCLVTGASAGIGADIARALARRGHHVTLVARREDRLIELAEEIQADGGAGAATDACDLSDGVKRRALVAKLARRKRKVEVLVNNAGYGSGGPFTELDPGREVAMVRINVEALVALCGELLPAMVQRGRGAVLNLGSLIAFQPVPFQATYGATKAFVLSFGDALHEELRGSGVTVTTLCPGPVRTEFGEQGGFGGADERIPGFLWLEAAEVAEAGVRGLENGARVVVPGVVNQLGALGGQHTPRALLLPLLRRLWPVS